jgi:ABC-type lipoprotein export system ATPase subunit
MGPSGSGKTTLLDLLAGRKTQGETSGSILYGAQAPTRALLRRATGYVEQFGELLWVQLALQQSAVRAMPHVAVVSLDSPAAHCAPCCPWPTR